MNKNGVRFIRSINQEANTHLQKKIEKQANRLSASRVRASTT